ncbi:Clp protease N-terminal domain-containing protein [Streptomyces roseoverticillatus]|uniref:Clp protease N-terminal domain-containing protein n=1 Tax=Streptomyces roseoverticillatus TaxID=66429 RepID=UPI0004C21407|nr:Clp protease N-terminal domain-containing protein [Streptomyces roseoverticillatus]
MFERFTLDAREAVLQAQEEARTLGHAWIGSEHLLLGVLGQAGAPVVTTLARFGVTPEGCRSALAPAGPLGAGDAEALRAFGIDLEAVRARAEDTFGPGALDRSGPPEERWRILPFGRGRRAEPRRRVHVPFTPRAKKALERSLREAHARKERHIGAEHVALGVLDPDDKVTAGVLRKLGTDTVTVRNGILQELPRAA